MARKKKTDRKKTSRKKKQRRWGRRLLYMLLGAAGLSFAVVLPLRWVDPVSSAFMLADDSGITPIEFEWLDWDKLGDSVPLAMIASEDQRFADHFGLDLKAIQKAVDEKDDRGYLRGASTISQQTAKNLFLWPGRSFSRKALEAWLTVVMELGLPKRRILEIYLNIAEYGPGIYGVGAASRHYFGKSPAQLGDHEAALLAAVLPNPKQLQLNPPSDYVRERQAWVMTQIARLRREAWLTRIDG
jgi:monofunctional biosynthetic peptidoglycan transglycosylase